MSSALPPIDQSLLPAAVREGGAERRQQYEAALSFERVLVGQMTQRLAGSLADDEGSAATQQLQQSLPGTLADALMAGGGIGLAAQLDAAWHPATPSASNATSGGAAA